MLPGHGGAAGIRVRPRGARGWGRRPPARPLAAPAFPSVLWGPWRLRRQLALCRAGTWHPPPASLPHCCDSELTQQQDPGVRLASMLPSLGPSHRRHPRRPIPGDPSFRSVSHREMSPVTGWLCLQSGRWDTTFLNFPTSFLNRGGQRLRRWDLPSAQNPLVYWKSRAGPERLP